MSGNAGVPPTLPLTYPGLPVAFVPTGVPANQADGKPASPKIRVKPR